MHALPASLLAGLTLGAAATALAAAPDPLAGYRWKARLLVVIAPGEGDASLARQRAIFEEAARSNAERDLVLIEGVGSGEAARDLRRRFRVVERDFAAILVGKDGGEKLRSSSPLAAERLHETIDAMPMRRDEMRRRP